MNSDVNSIEDGLANGDADFRSAYQYALEKIDQGAHTSSDVIALFHLWVWSAVAQRRGDLELRKWSDLLYLLSSETHGKSCDVGPYDVMAGLIDSNIIAAESHNVGEVLKRKHVIDVLRQIHNADGDISKAELMRLLDVKGPNMSNIARLMMNAHLIKNEKRGKETFFLLTEVGKEHLPARHESPARREKQRPLMLVQTNANNSAAPPEISDIMLTSINTRAASRAAKG